MKQFLTILFLVAFLNAGAISIQDTLVAKKRLEVIQIGTEGGGLLKADSVTGIVRRDTLHYLIHNDTVHHIIDVKGKGRDTIKDTVRGILGDTIPFRRVTSSPGDTLDFIGYKIGSPGYYKWIPQANFSLATHNHGTGTLYYLPRFAGSTTFENTNIYNSLMGNTGFGNNNPLYMIDVKLANETGDGIVWRNTGGKIMGILRDTLWDLEGRDSCGMIELNNANGQCGLRLVGGFGSDYQGLYAGTAHDVYLLNYTSNCYLGAYNGSIVFENSGGQRGVWSNLLFDIEGVVKADIDSTPKQVSDTSFIRCLAPRDTAVKIIGKTSWYPWLRFIDMSRTPAEYADIKAIGGSGHVYDLLFSVGTHKIIDFHENCGVAIGKYADYSTYTPPDSGLIVSGKVGIGTELPQYKFELYDNDANGGIIALTRDAGTYRGNIFMGRHNSGTIQLTTTLESYSDNASPNNGVFRISLSNSSGVSTEYLRFRGNNGGLSLGSGYVSYVAPANGMIIEGGVSIGTINSTSKLQVVGLSYYVNKTAAKSAGLTAGAMYCTGADSSSIGYVNQ